MNERLTVQVPSDADLMGLCEDILRLGQQDFRHYVKSSLSRRVTLALRHLNLNSVSELRARLASPGVLPSLLSFLSVQVSEMFRDARYFLTLRQHIVPYLATYPSFKVWIAGCAGGEEVYSIAIVLAEADLLKRAVIYATDVSEAAIARASAGRFPMERMADYSMAYRAAGGVGTLSDFYVAAYGQAVMDPELRAKVVFTEHSLATDHVFSEVDVVSCRNTLIYFDKPLQDRALGLFTAALSRRGFLGLGSRETVRFSTEARHYEELPESERWFRKR